MSSGDKNRQGLGLNREQVPMSTEKEGYGTRSGNVEMITYKRQKARYTIFSNKSKAKKSRFV